MPHDAGGVVGAHPRGGFRHVDDHVVFQHVGIHAGVRVAPEEHPHLAAVDNLSHFGAGALRPGDVQQVLLLEVFPIKHSLPHLVLGEDELRLAVVVHGDVVGPVEIQAPGAEHFRQMAEGHEGNLVLDAIAVGIVVLKGQQHPLELLGGFGDGQPQLIQPFFVDGPGVAGRAGIVVVDVGQGVDRTVLLLHGHPDGFVVFHQIV